MDTLLKMLTSVCFGPSPLYFCACALLMFDFCTFVPSYLLSTDLDFVVNNNARTQQCTLTAHRRVIMSRRSL